MSPVSIRIKKYGQITRVSVDGKEAYISGNTVKAEKKNLDALFKVMVIENVIVEIDE